MPFQEGDVVLVHYPFRDESGNIQTKLRPAVIYKMESEEERIMIQVTSKNRSSKLPGFWITRESEDGKAMGILVDSFINLSDMKYIRINHIVRLIGKCPIMEKIQKGVDALKLKASKIN